MFQPSVKGRKAGVGCGIPHALQLHFGCQGAEKTLPTGVLSVRRFAGRLGLGRWGVSLGRSRRLPCRWAEQVRVSKLPFVQDVCKKLGWGVCILLSQNKPLSWQPLRHVAEWSGTENALTMREERVEGSGLGRVRRLPVPWGTEGCHPCLTPASPLPPPTRVKT